MLNFLAEQWLAQGGPPVFTYITTRALLGFITAFLLSLLLGRPIIKWLFMNGFRDYPRDFGTIDVSGKHGTPTMGGVIIACVALISILLWADVSNPQVLLVLASMLVFSVLGYRDDYCKMKSKSAEGGVSRLTKIVPQVLFGLFLGCCAYFPELGFFAEVSSSGELCGSSNYCGDAVFIPFVKEPLFHLSYGVLFLGVIWSGGITNAVNYTDGLDGLLSIPALFCFLVLGIFSYIHGNAVLAEYLHYPYLFGVGELAVVCSIFMGCCLGFLWFNAFPAEVFMGDFGSLMLGGVLMTISFMIREEVVFLIVGGVIIFEFLSSVIQDYVFIKGKGMRLFYEAPFHRSLKKGHGIAESKVVVRYWIIAAVIAAFAVITLKIR